MPPISITRPATDEYAAGFHGYISRVEDIVDAVRVLSVQEDRVTRLLGGLSDESAACRYAPEKWSVKEMVGHMSDAERIFVYRLLRIARGDATPLAGFEENDYVRAAASDARTISDLIDEWRSVRRATMTLISSLTATAWTHRGTSNGHPMSARALAYVIVGHVDHHLHVLATRYAIAES